MPPFPIVPHDLYRHPPDFKALGVSYPPLHPHIFLNAAGHATINFKDVAAQRRLTEALLRCDFGLKLTLPLGRLCPTVPNRLNYVRWLESIVASSRAWDSSNPSLVVGLDVGTGASAIYPLLACAVQQEWNMIGTDVDEISLQSARGNIAMNELQARIDIRTSTPDGPILHPLSDVSLPPFEFAMCNPPFYSSREDIERSANDKEFDPHAVCTGSELEMITPGGEVTFVKRMIDESLNLKMRCRWFTSLLGKLSSVTEVVAYLKQLLIDNYAVTEFVQGHTRRWAIGWSFGLVRLPDSIAHASSASLHGLMPLPTTVRQVLSVPSSSSSGLVRQGREDLISLAAIDTVLKAVLNEIDGVSVSTLNHNAPVPSHLGNFESISLVISARSNTWSRAARRSKALGNDSSNISVTGGKPLVVCEISVWIGDGPKTKFKAEVGSRSVISPVLTGQWRVGKARSDFESFWSHICRKMIAGLSS